MFEDDFAWGCTGGWSADWQLCLEEDVCRFGGREHSARKTAGGAICQRTCHQMVGKVWCLLQPALHLIGHMDTSSSKPLLPNHWIDCPFKFGDGDPQLTFNFLGWVETWVKNHASWSMFHPQREGDLFEYLKMKHTFHLEDVQWYGDTFEYLKMYWNHL